MTTLLLPLELEITAELRLPCRLLVPKRSTVTLPQPAEDATGEVKLVKREIFAGDEEKMGEQ